jgi:hypothetical protein
MSATRTVSRLAGRRLLAGPGYDIWNLGFFLT